MSRSMSTSARQLLLVLSLTLLASLLPATTTAAVPGARDAAAPSPAARPATLHVATTGHDSARGSSAAPLRSIRAAVSRARSGDRIVVHGGVYHEGIVIPAGKRLSLRNARGSRVWLEGSRLVRGWRQEGGGYVHDGWRTEFDSSPTYHWGAPDNEAESWSFLNRAHPMAAHPDQVWVGSRELRQVASLARLRPGTFFVDDARDRLHVGTDPRGRSVRASDLAKAMSIRGRRTSVRGIGVRRFAPSVPHMGAVTVEAPGVTLRDLRIEDNATTGLHVSASNAKLIRLVLAGNGMLGAGATYADGLRINGLRVRGNNTERFNYSPVAGGIKVDRTRGIRVRNSVLSRNAGNGLWLDESSYDIRVTDSSMRDNLHHGLALEISAKAVVADTVIEGNADDGIKVNDTSDVRLWNNTVVGNGRPINIVQDDRDPADDETEGRDPRQPRPDRTMPWINGPVQVHNNILSASRSGNCLLCVEDYSGRFTAEELRVRASGNVYHRRDRRSPSWVVVWSRASRDPAVYTSLRGFRSATGQERRSLELVGAPAVTGSLRATKRVASRARTTAVLLPPRLARVLGRRSGERHLGAWLG
ncbi:right-handed parallel beta-helix repeat-containing protein [Nocardioides sp. cx-173]|uniref:right-handed parallel beta-helix repeat-containing protein n=1 Tax=Nocardioides sp. cx-173 TaxID=2898796 RepID=UPI001E4092B2|nr:right-handed parallel beta-helix repeat-containing protein [Nocardioides sp. cx-173]MCD4526676.1 right-handed parallel beta-helix repeat-containing protein [Nocardioides sp. cx-173]UGB42581.1 right-handed parallel beta-helix repeat-containing protein [Nocardioides sp. cx-173]